MLTTHLHLVLTLIMSGAIPLLLLNAYMVSTRTTIRFYFYLAMATSLGFTQPATYSCTISCVGSRQADTRAHVTRHTYTHLSMTSHLSAGVYQSNADFSQIKETRLTGSRICVRTLSLMCKKQLTAYVTNFQFFNQQIHFLFSYFCSIHPTHVSAVTLPSSRYIDKFTSLLTGPFGIITTLHCLRLLFTLKVSGIQSFFTFFFLEMFWCI
jgi:hypothetical protein